MTRVYMDANATTPLLPEVFEAMRPYFMEKFGNASSVHQFGQHTRGALEFARAQVALLVGAMPNEIIFTGGGTESDNLAIFGTLKPGDHMITSLIEHHAVSHAADVMEKNGVEVTRISVDARCWIDPESIRNAMRKNTRLVSIMAANNETGVMQPIEEISKIVKEAGALMHTDAIQIAGKSAINVNKMGCDLLTISGHKMHAPQGVGALYIKKGVELTPQMHGGSHERSRRAGTENVPGIVGFGCAAEIARKSLAAGFTKPIEVLRDKLEAGLLAKVESCAVNGAGQTRVPNTSNMRFDDVDSEALLIALDLKGLAVSAGSACSSGASEPSHVLTAMGLNQSEARSSLRFSLCRLSTDEEVEFALQVVPEAVARLRSLSPTVKR